MRTQTDLRRTITDQIIEALERGCPPWRRPWSTSPNGGSPKNAVSGKSYSGVNPLMLEVAARRHGFTSRWWATFDQWKKLGGRVAPRPDHVAPGRWGTSIVFCKPITRNDPAPDDDKNTYWTLRSYTVFNVDQVLGSAVDHLRVSDDSPPAVDVERRFEAAERAIAATEAEIRFGGDRACYVPERDVILMPHRHRFALPEFYDTLLHELTHWTEHPARLDWDRSHSENTYALGELIAELGSCYLAGELGLPIGETLENHAAYLGHWLEAMRADSRFLFRATAQATKAADYILSFSRAERPEGVPVLAG